MPRRLASAPILALLCLLGACARGRGGPRPRAHGDADVIVTNGQILTLDPRAPVVEAIAISGGRVRQLGSSRVIERLRGTRTRTIDLGGRTAVPGFIDCHSHVGFEAYPAVRRFEWDLSRDALVERVAALRDVEPDKPLVLSGWVPAHVTGTSSDLDAAAPDRPVMVIAGDGHAAWLNTAAMRWLGVGNAPNEPPDGVSRDPAGAPTGLFFGAGWGIWVHRRATELAPPGSIERGIVAELRERSAAGLTTLDNMSFSPQAIDALVSLADRGALPVRIRELVLGTSPDSARSMARVSSRRDLFRIAGAKFILDGAPFSGNAAYTGIARPGPLRMTAAELRDAIRAHAERGEQVAVHATGQAAVHAVLDAVEAVGQRAIDLRVRIEHADVVDPADEPRLHALGVVLSMQPAHFPGQLGAPYDRALIPPIEDWGFLRHFRNGVPMCLGADGPIPPLVSISLAMRGPTPAEAVSFELALTAHTLGGAFALREEADVGSLSPGKRADIVVLSHDPRGLEPEQVEALRVEQTILGGRPTFTRGAGP